MRVVLCVFVVVLHCYFVFGCIARGMVINVRHGYYDFVLLLGFNLINGVRLVPTFFF